MLSPLPRNIAMFHGYAHGAELHPGFAVDTYAIGFLTATAALHVSGLLLALATRGFKTAAFRRIIGGTIAVGGLALFWM